MKTWAVIRADEKYFDGYYGWDSRIHSDEQIVDTKHLPFELNAGMLVIVVGVGKRPTVWEVNELLNYIWEHGACSKCNQGYRGCKCA